MAYLCTATLSTHSSISPCWCGRVVDADLRDAAIALEHGDAVSGMDHHASIRHQMLLGFLVAFVESLLALTKQILRGAARMHSEHRPARDRAA